jgi:prepilin-type N-terminal cleavage/methylation domain-containing protein
MKKIYSSKKSAFSLIELSIVLIIIGLLIAGITGGASLIKNSELRTIAGEARGYQVAVNGFYSLYDELPGDLSKAVSGSTIYAGPTTGSGENGKIEYFASDVVGNFCDTSSSSSTEVACNSESIAAWEQLIKTGTIDSTLVLTFLTIGQSQVPGTNMPGAKIKYAGWHFDYRNRVGAAGDYSAESFSTSTPTIAEAGVHSPQNVIVLTAATTGSTATTATLVNGETNTSVAALTGSDALSIDTKVDDGIANTGKVRGLNPGGVNTTCYTINDAADANYIITSASNKVCALTFQVDPKSS